MEQVREKEERSSIHVYDEVAARARRVFVAKNHDYGDAWRVWHMQTFIDQLHAKVHRIQSLHELEQQGKVAHVPESLTDALMDIQNYAIIALMWLHLHEHGELGEEEILEVQSIEGWNGPTLAPRDGEHYEMYGDAHIVRRAEPAYVVQDNDPLGP